MIPSSLPHRLTCPAHPLHLSSQIPARTATDLKWQTEQSKWFLFLFIHLFIHLLIGTEQGAVGQEQREKASPRLPPPAAPAGGYVSSL